MAENKTVLSFNKPTPKWATWIFRVEFLLNKAFLYGLSQDLFGTVNIKKALVWAILIDGIIWGIGRAIGVQKKDFEEAAN